MEAAGDDFAGAGRAAVDEADHREGEVTAVGAADIGGFLAVAVADVAPIPGPLGYTLDFAAAGLAEADILLSACSSEEKKQLSIINALNLGIGLGSGGLAGTFERGAQAAKFAKSDVLLGSLGIKVAAGSVPEAALVSGSIAKSLEKCEGEESHQLSAPTTTTRKE